MSTLIIAAAYHRAQGDYCAIAHTTHDCPENHEYSQPIQVPTSHSGIVDVVRHQKFLVDVGQTTIEQAYAEIAEADRRYLQLGQYFAGQHGTLDEGSVRIVAVTR